MCMEVIQEKFVHFMHREADILKKLRLTIAALLFFSVILSLILFGNQLRSKLAIYRFCHLGLNLSKSHAVLLILLQLLVFLGNELVLCPPQFAGGQIFLVAVHEVELSATRLLIASCLAPDYTAFEHVASV